MLALALALAACKKDSTGPEAIDPVGSWSGTTSQSRAISFQATKSAVNNFSLSFSLHNLFCSYSANVTIFSMYLDSDNTFSTFRILDQYTNIDLKGQVTSSSAASGTFELTDIICHAVVNASWTASKQ